MVIVLGGHVKLSLALVSSSFAAWEVVLPHRESEGAGGGQRKNCDKLVCTLVLSFM